MESLKNTEEESEAAGVVGGADRRGGGGEGGGLKEPTEGLSFQQHRLLMKLNFQYPTTSALMISQFYRYGLRM